MKRKMKIGVGSLSQALDRFERSWERAAKAGARGAEVRLTFESLPLLLRNLTPARWALLEDLKRHGPLSINELARRLGRDYKNVHTDVSRLTGGPYRIRYKGRNPPGTRCATFAA